MNDTYPDKERLQHPYLYHVPSNRRIPLGHFHSPPEYAGEWRCDTHPRYSPDGTKVVIDSTHEGLGRQMYLIDFEAGTRVPFIVRWPGGVKRGVSDALVSQVDWLASFAAFTGQKLAEADAPDSFDVMNALLGKSKTGRDHLVEQAGALSLRQGTWKYIEPGRGARMNVNTNTETGNDPNGQLYDLSRDPGERENLAARHSDKAKEMAAQLERIKQAGRSRRP